ncbi:MAG: succinate dehydrogenase, cytochrome b556 subunit [Gammaproteobacteria bacterium]
MSDIKTPLSPHLQIYKPQLTSVLSITHRATGIALCLGALLLCCWLAAIAYGDPAYALLLEQLQQWYGMAVMIGFVFALYYHLLNGIRHLFWDIGAGLDLESTYRSGYAVVTGSVLLTAMTVYVRLNL